MPESTGRVEGVGQRLEARGPAAQPAASPRHEEWHGGTHLPRSPEYVSACWPGNELGGELRCGGGCRPSTALISWAATSATHRHLTPSRFGRATAAPASPLASRRLAGARVSQALQVISCRYRSLHSYVGARPDADVKLQQMCGLHWGGAAAWPAGLQRHHQALCCADRQAARTEE